MTDVDLAGIVERAEESVLWAPGTLASDPKVNDRLHRAVQDRRALLALLREAREALWTAYQELVQDVDPDAVIVSLARAAERLAALDPATTEPKEPE